MKPLHSLQFLTSAFSPLSICIACLLSAAVAGLAVWFACRNTEKKSASQRDNDKKKLEFLTYLIHELRTPVTMIMTPLQKLMSKSYDEDTGKELQSIHKNAVNIVSLLDKSMNVDRIVDNGSDLTFREINLVKYLYNLQNLFTYQTKLANIELSFHCDKDRIPVWIDRSAFDEILMTLVSNSIKYTPEGGKVDIETASDDKYATIVIKNNGRQIPDYIIGNLFELFARSESGTVVGTNMDFYLCKEVVSLHKGTIKVANHTDSEGVSCTIKLLLGNSHLPKNRLSSRKELLEETWRNINLENSVGQAGESKDSPSRNKYSVIGIDQSADICLYLHALLDPVFNVTTFTSPAEGLKSILADPPDLVIAEVMMTGIDGISLVKQLKGNSNTAHVPVLLLTALPGEEVRVQGLLTGADAIISKPFNEEELILNCNNLIKSRSRLASHIKDMQIAKDVIQPIELQSNDDMLMQKVLSTINERISDPDLNVEMLADAIGISRGHLHRKIKEITGSSPGEYIRSIRLNQAAQLLRGEKKNISQIAYSVGYSNPSVFSTAFKQFFGMSAKDYQKRYSGSEEPEYDETKPQP